MSNPFLNPPQYPSSFTRRQFLRHTGFALAAGAITPSARTFGGVAEEAGATAKKALVGSSICIWSQCAERDHKNLDVQEVISALRDSGYDYLEKTFDVGRPDENARFAAQLRAKGLQPTSLYTSGRLHEACAGKAVVTSVLDAAKVAQQAGFSIICCNPDPIDREKTDEELANQASALTDLGQGLNAMGMRLAIHQHVAEMANHAREFHSNFRHTDPAIVGWCYDVHWVWRGGVMPLDGLKEYGSRVVTWHLRQSRDGIWWEELAAGDIDYEAVAAYSKVHCLARRFSVELALEPGTKITRSLVENHRRSREFVRRVFES
jgi:inosose dehydratase